MLKAQTIMKRDVVTLRPQDTLDTAIEYLADKQKAHIIEALCKGCGTCTATCPSKSITLRHFTDKQLMSEMVGAMEAMFELEMAA